MEEKKFDLSQLYIVDFVKNLGHKKNIFAVVYLVLNVVVISLLMGLFEPNPWLAALYGLLIYIVTAVVALSPLGEWMFRMSNGCQKITDPAILNRLEPLFQEVKQRAMTRQTDFKIDEGISLYICDDDCINAFAMGRRTVCVTNGMLALSDEQIKAVLGHEFGHLATHDTDLKLLITVVDRPKGEFYLDYISQFDANCQMVLSGLGTARSDVVEILGLEPHKAVILSVIREDMTETVMNNLEDKFATIKNGKGISFAVPLSSVIGVNLYQFLSNNRQGRGE